MRRQRVTVQERLAEAVKARGSVRAVAPQIPVHFSHLYRIVQGTRNPDLGLAVTFEREFGISVEEWPLLRDPVRELLRLRGVAA